MSTDKDKKEKQEVKEKQNKKEKDLSKIIDNFIKSLDNLSSSNKGSKKDLEGIAYKEIDKTDNSKKQNNKDKKTQANEKASKAVETNSINTTSSKQDSKDILSLQDENLEIIVPVVPIVNEVFFPHTEHVFRFYKPRSTHAIKSIKSYASLIMLCSVKPNIKNLDENIQNKIYQIGTVSKVDRTLANEENTSILTKGLRRGKIEKIIQKEPFLVAKVKILKDENLDTDKTNAFAIHLKKLFKKAIELGKPVEFLNFMKLIGRVDPSELGDQIAATLNIPVKDKQKILELTDVEKRLKFIIEKLTHEIKIIEIERDVLNKTQKKFDESMRETILRERLKTIQKELGEFDDSEDLANEYEKKLKKINVPKSTKEKISKEIKRFRLIPSNSPESAYLRDWLETIFSLPWNKSKNSKIDLAKAQEILDKDHYGLKEIKDRIIEYLSVLKLKQQKDLKKPLKNTTVLCFVGPPGVGKTSIGKAIAKALNREFVKASLGGVRDEAEIRGHRRTYVGAMPGKIIKGIIQAKSMNPVFILDEIDKLTSDFHGDPSAALLEVLDPEQNEFFEDHYLDVPFDLSQVIFITTANSIDTIPYPLLDRMEIIEFSSYTFEEKFNIAKLHLLDKSIKSNALTKKNVHITDDALDFIIHRYTKEAGVRQLERTLNKIMRKIARKIVEGKVKSVNVDKQKVREFLGPEIYDINVTQKQDMVGIVTGLAWTRMGGDIIFVEATLTPGKGLLKLTGQLGDVMKESAQAALTYVMSQYKKYNIDPKLFSKNNIHIHVPEGATPKDGPSAGITMATAIYSIFTNKKVKRDVAMTGEITLKGNVLRIGGLKEKLIAASLAGCKTVIIPKENKRDLEKIPKNILDKLKIIPVEKVDEVFKIATK